MKINRIELYNIGSYEGLNEFNIAAQRKEGKISVIGGKNGAGKTTLFSGIKLCLYGHKEAGYQAINAWYKNSIKKLVNDKAKLENNATAYVLLDLSIFNGQEWDNYILKRSWKLDSSSFEEFVVIRNEIELSAEEIVDFENYLLNLIPPELFNLYFFDGEQIADFFLEEDNGGRIKEAFLTICGYDTFDILYKNFKRLNKSADVNNEALNAYFAAEEELHDAEKLLRQCEQLIEELNNVIVEIDTELAGREKRFKDCGGVSLEEWNDKFVQLKNEERIREEKNNWLKVAANDILPYVIMKNKINALISLMEKEQEQEKSTIFEEMAKELMPDVLATVGETFPELNSSLQDSIFDSLMSRIGLLNDHSEMILKLSKNEYNSLLVTVSRLAGLDGNDIVKAKKDIKSSIRKSQKIRDEIEKSNITEIDSYLKEKDELIDKKAAAVEKRQVKYEELKELQVMVEKKSALYKLAEKALDKHLKNESISDLTTKSILFLDVLQKRLFKSEIEKVERLFMKKMRQLMRKESFISDISIDDDFNVHVYKNVRIDTRGVCERISNSSIEDYVSEFGVVHCNDVLKVSDCESLEEFVEKYKNSNTVFEVMMEFDKSTMSKGEKQVFIMALYWSIMQLCNKEIPFLIDTPFARIDTEHRAHITEHFFKELRGQVIIFSTDEEITEEHMEVIGSDLQSKFLIENMDNKKTVITPNMYFGG